MLRTVGLRRTPARIAVLARLASAEGPVAHMDLAHELAPVGFDQSTIYRNLIDLAGAGLVDRSALGGRVWCYALKDDGSSRTIRRVCFECSHCATRSLLTDVEVKVAFSRSGHEELRTQPLEVVLSGRCADCA